MPRLSLLVLTLLLVALPLGDAHARRKRLRVKVTYLGPAREITHSSSASRDTAALGLMLAPRPILSGGGDLGFLGLAFSGVTLRLGFFGMLELESEDRAAKGNPQPWVGDIRFWRGLYGLSLAVSFDRWARRLLGPGSALEVTLSFRHESEHYTGSNDGDAGTDYGRVPHIGNFVMPDVALRKRFRSVDLVARLQWKGFVPAGLRSYVHGPGADLHVRWRACRWVHPFVSIFGEYVFGGRQWEIGRVPDTYLVRGLLGVILPSRAGDLYLYFSADVGHRKGLAVFTEEGTLGFGVRAAFF